jgi:kinetochore protein Nuf2
MPYSFPPLSVADIIYLSSELNIPIQEEDLTNPTPQSLHGIFECFTSLLAGFSKADYKQPHFGAMDLLSYPDLHEDSIPELAFYRTL